MNLTSSEIGIAYSLLLKPLKLYVFIIEPPLALERSSSISHASKVFFSKSLNVPELDTPDIVDDDEVLATLLEWDAIEFDDFNSLLFERKKERNIDEFIFRPLPIPTVTRLGIGVGIWIAFFKNVLTLLVWPRADVEHHKFVAYNILEY